MVKVSQRGGGVCVPRAPRVGRELPRKVIQPPEGGEVKDENQAAS